MSSSWGNDRHGPGGDQSWLGGRDRDTAGGNAGGGQSSGWSSDFSSGPDSSADSDVGAGGQSSSGALPVRGPEFGRVDEANARRSSTEGGGWMSEFTGDRGGRGGRSGGGGQTRGLLPQLLIGAVAIAIIIFAATMTGSSSGSNFGFFLLVLILPIVRRLIRSATRGNRRR